jgi:excisionase family DNA binding protein
MSSTEQPRLHKLEVFLQRTDLSRSTAYREIALGHLKATRIGRTLRISEAEICRYISAAEQAGQDDN